MADIRISCTECRNEFTISIKEQNFYIQKGFKLPKRCTACRKKRREEQAEIERKLKLRKDEEELANILQTLPYKNIVLNNIVIKKPSKTLFIFGNGFDIMHDVKSSYNDFQKTLGKNSRLRELLETYLKSDDLWYNFEESLAHLDAGSMLDMVGTYLDIFDAYDEDAQAADYFAAIDTAMEPIYTITNELPKRFRKWVEGLTAGDERPLIHLLSKDSQYLNFNYTDFPELLYNIPTKNIKYIHGCRKKVKWQPCDELILGHVPDVDYFENYEPDKDLMPKSEGEIAFVEMAMEQGVDQWVNYYEERFTKSTYEIIDNNIEFFDKAKLYEDIYVIGHSLSEVDYPYFIKIAEINQGKASWHLGYHSLDDMNRLIEFVNLLNIKNIDVFRI